MIVTNLQPPAREPAPGSFHYASLALAGLVPDNDATPGAAARPQRRVRRNGNATNAPSMAVTMRSIRRMDTSNAETASHAATVLYRPSELAGMDDDDADDGMPLHEVQAYFGLRNGNQAVDDLVAGAMAALHGNFQRCGVRIDFWFTTREAGVPATHYSIPHARLNGLIREVPRLFQGLRAVAGNVGQLRECCSHALARFKQEIARMPITLGSNRVLDRLVSAQVWAVPRSAAGAQLVAGIIHMRKAGYVDEGAGAVLVDGEPVLSYELYASRGIILNWPERKDSLCIARAIMTGLDPILESRSDANLYVILSEALQGARAVLRSHQRKLIDACGHLSTVLKERHETNIALTNKRIEDLEAKLVLARRSLTAQQRHVRVAGEDCRAKLRYRTIEGNLQAAFRGTHPLIDFSKTTFFNRAQPVNAETVDIIRSCVRPGVKLKLQFWGIGMEDKVGLNYPADGANLSFLESGGRVINLLVAYRHASYLVDIGGACNHKPTGNQTAGFARSRSYCGLCGAHGSKGNAGDQLRVYDHQLKGCPVQSRMVLTSPLSASNRRQLDRRDFAALNRSLTLSTLCGDNDAVCAVLLINRPNSSQLSAWERTKSEELVYSTSASHGDATTQLLQHMAQKSVADELLALLHHYTPKNPEQLSTLREVRPSESTCFGCQLPVTGPSRWKLQSMATAFKPPAAVAAPGLEAEDSDAESVDEEDVDLDGVTASVGDASGESREDCTPVEHHCHASGAVYWAHADCNSFMRQSSNTLKIEVTTRLTMALVVAVCFSRSFIESFLDGRPPTLSKREGIVKKVSIRVLCTPRAPWAFEIAARRANGASEAEAAAPVTRYLTIEFRSIDAMLPSLDLILADPATMAEVHAKELVSWAEREFSRTRLWAPAFSTSVGYARGCLHDSASRSLGPGMSATSLVSEESLANVKRMTVGGMMVMGEHVETELEAPLDRSRAILYLDATSAYPFQMRRFLPLREDADALTHDFSTTLVEGLSWLDAPLVDELVERVEVWGAFPDALHASLGALPPTYSRVETRSTDLSRFQRLHMSLDVSDSPTVRTVGHFFPLVGAVMFKRSAKILRRLGFEFSKLGKVFATPASPWALEFSREAEACRRAAAARGDKVAVADIKQVMVSVIGALNIDASKYTRFKVVKQYDEMEDPAALESSRMTSAERIADDPRFTLRSFTAGDTVLYEMDPVRTTHRQQTLANVFIMEMQRCDMLEKWYGSETQKGLKELFPSARICYGNTDSLIVDLRTTPGLGFADVRHELLFKAAEWLDISNVPATSTFFSTLPDDLKPLLDTVKDNAGKWGCWKEETGMAGIEAIVVNGPNRWGFRVIQLDSDTLPEHKGDYKQDVLKSIPRVWKEAETPPTLEEFAASWLGKDLPEAPPLPPRLGTIDKDLGTLAEIPVQRRHVSPWGNQACIVSRTPPYKQWPLGSKVPEALACVAGTAW